MEAHSPFADFVGVTVPSEHWLDLQSEVVVELESLGMSLETSDERGSLWRSVDGRGTVKAKRYQQVWALGVSGSVCSGLRAANRFGSFLAAVAARPHRVTRLDASVDVQEDAAPVVARFIASGRRGDLSLTRKRIPPSSVDSYLGLRCDGVESGTVYLGPKHADVRMVVYDKRHERICRKLPDIGNLTRYELKLKSGVGISLRDCALPGPVFWHFAAPDFLPRPPGVADWVAAGEGFELQRLEPFTPFQRMRMLVDSSLDMGRLLTLADQVGPYGFRSLVAMIEKRAGVQGLAPAGTAPLASSNSR